VVAAAWNRESDALDRNTASSKLTNPKKIAAFAQGAGGRMSRRKQAPIVGALNVDVLYQRAGKESWPKNAKTRPAASAPRPS